MAGATLSSRTEMLTSVPSDSTTTTGAHVVCCNTFSTNTLTITVATGVSSHCDQALRQSATTVRAVRRLASAAGSSARIRRRVDGALSLKVARAAATEVCAGT